MHPLQLVQFALPAPEPGEVLSPESHVFVALMSVEEGPNKAVMLGVAHAAPAQGAQQGAGPETNEQR